MAIVYQYDSEGYYVGPVEDYDAAALPHNATRTAPITADGFVPRFNGTGWEFVQNHKYREGYLNGRPHKITEYGPLPDGFRETPPPPTEAEMAGARRAAIAAELDGIDRRGRRASRAAALALARGQAVAQADQDKLAELEALAETLRAERARLKGKEAEA